MSAVLLAALILSQMSTAAQTVDIVPDAALLRAPFSSQDEERFRKPDKIFYPETWFHFIGGNVSKEGIDADLQAIHDAGLSGIQWFHGYFGGPWPATGHQLTTLSPEWEDMVGYLGRKADSLGLRLTVQTCPGWSMAGGPWITPENAMREIVWTRTDVPAGNKFSSLLEKAVSPDEPWRDYHDIAVLAFPTPLGDTGTPLQPSVIEAADDSWKALVEGRDGKGLSLKEASSNTVTFTLPEGSVVRTLELPPVGAFSHNFCYDPGIHVKLTAKTASGEEKTLVDADLPMSNWQDGNPYDMVFACNEVEDAKTYSFTLTNAHPATVRFVRFLSAARKNSWRGEAGWTLIAKELSQERPEQNPLSYVNSKDIIDITDKMDASGRLDWTAPVGDFPEGKWTVLRIGHVNTGRQNGPAPKEATGWEVNKLDTAFVTYQFNSYIGRLVDGPLKGLLNNMLMDSWECVSQTWTRYMKDEFQTRRHYDLTTWMPALFGWVVDDREQTSQFLADWRRTIHELFTQNFYGHMTRLAREKGMTASYETAAGDIFPAGPMEYYKYADVPMTEYWQPFGNFLANHNYKPIRPTASAARMYGKPRVSAESFTSFVLTWDEHLSMLREVANQNMVEGVTHTIFHTYTHNPDPDRYFPGTSFGSGIGTPFLRGQTWWPYIKHFNTYLARCAFMLERGRPVSSVLWYLGDETEQKPDQYTPFPEGFKYDYCNTDALLHRISIKDGKWVTPDGISYDLLWIPKHGRLLPETLERLCQFVAQGGHLVADEPTGIATLSAERQQASRFLKAKRQLFESGNVIQGTSLSDALQRLDLKPDVKGDILWLHRQDEGSDWYMICPKQEQAFSGNLAFRQNGRAELWNPMNGKITPIASQQDGEYASLDLNLSRGEMLFVVFRHDGQKAKEKSQLAERQPVASSWVITFPQGWGIEAPLSLNELKPWKDLPLSDEGKAFSGTATYETTFQLDHKPKRELLLNLGKVEEIAVVSVNGHVTDTLWAEPYATDITHFVRKGSNRLSVQVTSTWHNRLVYDARQPKELRKTWVINGPSDKAELRPSGLLGPVELVERR